MADALRILAIDGGGIRGVIPATVLVDLETRAGRPIAELFDLVAGTSTGGILALGVTIPRPDGRPAYRASDLVELYVREGPNIFHRSIFDRVRSLEGALDERYPADGLERVLEGAFGVARLRDALSEVIVTAYDTYRRQPFFFRSSRARRDPAYDYPMHLAARATSAAPTYFEAARVVNEASGDEYSLVDGGLFAANPAMVALAELLRGDRDRPVKLLSLGTGQHTRRYPWKEVKDWGALEWARPVIDMLLDGSSDATEFEAAQLTAARGDRYWRVQTELRKSSDNLDDATEDNLRHLQEEAGELVEREAAALAEATQALCRR
ncbi:MAG: patatin-like phospholipase family protein [Actinomycetota bacterium]|nr:patatin-like phospholipase family protein [Actinomycetota bacterium]